MVSFIFLSAVFASFVAVFAFSQNNVVTVINNDGEMIVNWDIFGFKGQGDPTKPNTNFIRKCGDVAEITKTKELYYTVKMGIFTDYIFSIPYTSFSIDTCMTLAGNARNCNIFGQCQPFMYSPYHPYDLDKFNIDEVVVDIKYKANVYGSSQEGITKDGRKSISSWGSYADNSVGGCCRVTNDTAETEGWYKPYNITATPLNMNFLYLHRPKMNGITSSFAINSKVTDIYMRFDASIIGTICAWEITDVATGTSIAPAFVNCVLSTPITAAAVDKNYSVTVNIKPITGSSKVLWNTNETTATMYIIVPKIKVNTTTTEIKTTEITTTKITTRATKSNLTTNTTNVTTKTAHGSTTTTANFPISKIPSSAISYDNNAFVGLLSILLFAFTPFTFTSLMMILQTALY